MYDWVIAGAGFAGSTLARKLAEDNFTVLVVERGRSIGGTAYDEYDDHGVLVQRHGGHIFHSNSDEVVQFLSRFTEWRLYEHRVRASVQGQLVPLPINLDTVNALYGLSLTTETLPAWFAERSEPRDRIKTAEDVVVSKVGRELYRLLYENYSRKQWGCDPSELNPQVTARVPVRTNRDDRYFTDRYQMMPVHGFSRLIASMLDHPSITVMLGADAREVLKVMPTPRGTVWTGPIDEFFDNRLGALPYRSMEFTFESYHGPLRQPVATINYPNEHPYVRSTEFRHITGQHHDWTTIVYERPTASGPPLYPVPSPASERLLQEYKDLAAKEAPEVIFAGRLGSYRYYNMDQVIAQSLSLHKGIKASMTAYNRPMVGV